jgi:hypothetical protein
MYDAPCSRVGHVYRGSMPFEDDRKGVDFLSVSVNVQKSCMVLQLFSLLGELQKGC